MWISALRFRRIVFFFSVVAISPLFAETFKDRAVLRTSERVLFVSDLKALNRSLAFFRCLRPDSLLLKSFKPGAPAEQLSPQKPSLRANRAWIEKIASLVKLMDHVSREMGAIPGPLEMKDRTIASVRKCKTKGRDKWSVFLIQAEDYLDERFRPISPAGRREKERQAIREARSLKGALEERLSHRLLFK